MELDLMANSAPRRSLLKIFIANCACVTGILGIIGMPLFPIILNANAFSLVGSFISEAK
jgi:hypothetical protein